MPAFYNNTVGSSPYDNQRSLHFESKNTLCYYITSQDILCTKTDIASIIPSPWPAAPYILIYS